MSTTGSERRGARRVDAKLSVQVSVPGTDGTPSTATLETINISTSGVYFRSDRFMAPLTKLALELELEVPADGGEPERRLFPCEGMVVRTTPEAETADCRDYEVAVFFTHVEDDSAHALEQHISAFIARQG